MLNNGLFLLTDKMKSRGFSLIEILIGITLVGLVFSVAGTVLFSTLKSSRKAEAIAIAKSEGAYAIQAIGSSIRYAKSIICGGSNLKLQINKSDTDSLVYSYVTSTPNKIASSSGTISSPGTAINVTTNGVQLSLSQCGGEMFTCNASNTAVNICFAIDTVNGIDVSDKAMGTGVNGIVFKTGIGLVNNN